MGESVTLLPGNATPLERTLSAVNDDFNILIDPYNNILVADNAPSPDFLPFLVWQYGLGELSPYLPNLYDLISAGIQWQRIRGTPAAISLGLSWLGYGGSLEEVPTRRRRWNRFYWELDRVRDNDYPDLVRIDGIVALSPPERSIFARGFKTYDIRCMETSYGRTSGSMTSDSSGVFIPNAAAKWSFGRHYESDHLFSQAELTALDVWIPEVGMDTLWTDADYLWADDDVLWVVVAAGERLVTMAGDICDLSAYVQFTDADDDVIGYARATVRPVQPGDAGEYDFGGGTRWTSFLIGPPTAVMVVAMSGFGDGNGQTATKAAVLFDATRDGDVKPGTLWLEPDQLTGGTVIAEHDVNIPFGLTVRERARFSLRMP